MTLNESYEYCEGVARTRARNFYYSFVLLPAAKRRAICAMYAFMRYCDDLSDDETGTDRAGAVTRWRADLDAALEGRFSGHAVWPAFHDAVTHYRIPHQYFRDMIDGVSSDLEPRRVATFDELYHYCYQVASVVGLTIIHIFGFESPRALELAEKCGIAFQLTNILRDVREDAERGRVYLPAEDLARFNVTPDELRNGIESDRFRALMEFESRRAADFYETSRPLIGLVDQQSRSSLWALIEIYRRLLNRIGRSGYAVLRHRVRVPTWEKVWVVAAARIRPHNRA